MYSVYMYICLCLEEQVSEAVQHEIDEHDNAVVASLITGKTHEVYICTCRYMYIYLWLYICTYVDVQKNK